MNRLLSYPWAILFGLYFYGLFQLAFLARFGRLNLELTALDGTILLNGIISVLLLQFFMKRLSGRRASLFIPFIVAVPFAYIGTLGGDLLGIPFMLVFGLGPFVIVLPIGYVVVKKTVRKDTADLTNEGEVSLSSSNDRTPLT